MLHFLSIKQVAKNRWAEWQNLQNDAGIWFFHGPSFWPGGLWSLEEIPRCFFIKFFQQSPHTTQALHARFRSCTHSPCFPPALLGLLRIPCWPNFQEKKLEVVAPRLALSLWLLIGYEWDPHGLYGHWLNAWYVGMWVHLEFRFHAIPWSWVSTLLFGFFVRNSSHMPLLKVNRNIIFPWSS